MYEFWDDLFQQEILEQNLNKLVDDDEGDSIPIPRTSSKYKVLHYLHSGYSSKWNI